MSQSSKIAYEFGSVTAKRFIPTNKTSVVQGTSLTTSVTIENPIGKITTFTSSLGTNGNASFSVASSFVNADSVILTSISKYSSSGTGIPVVRVTNYSAGSLTITLHNASTTAAMNNPVEIAYNII
jgi:hypothetical protein